MKFEKYIKNLPALTLLMLLFAGVFLSSCEKEEEISRQVVLNSFGPSGVKHGDQIRFIGQNLDKVTAIQLPGVEVSKSEFVTQSSTLIELVVPEQATAGKVILRTPNGDIESKAMLNFLVPVVIESITPEARPGENITIRGDKVNWIESVMFNDGIVVTEFVSKSLNELVVTVPMEAQSGHLVFATGGTKPLSFASEEELIVTVPVVSSFSPASIRHMDELTISGTNLDLVTSVVFVGDTVREFVSQTADAIVLAVPAKALKGKVTLMQASPVNVVTANELTIILPVGTEVTPKPAVPGTDKITIKGTNLDLIGSLTLPGIPDPIPASSFERHTAEEIVVALPEGAKAGGIKYTTIHGYSSNLGVTVILPGAGPSPLPIALYDESMAAGGGDWSWEKVVSDPANTEQFYSGDFSWKFETSNSGGVSAGGITPIDASGMGVFTFALYGGPGTEGAQVAAILNDKWDSYNAVTLKEGQWTVYEIPLDKYPTVDLTAITRFIFKVEGMPSSTIYVDRVGFDTGGPAALAKVIYDDAPKNGFGTWGGWGGATFDVNSTENVREGSKSIKVTYAGDWGGAAQFGGATVPVEGATNYVFSVFGEEGTGGKQIKVIVKSTAGEGSKMIDVVEGEWTEVVIPLSELGSPEDIKEVSFQDAGFTGVVHIDYIGLR